MAMTHTITSPADLAADYRDKAAIAQRAADTASGRHQRELWQVQADIWSHAARIAAATTFKPEAS